MTILFCPICCSPLDGPDSGHFAAVCQVCGTEFSVEIDPAKVEKHSVV